MARSFSFFLTFSFVSFVASFNLEPSEGIVFSDPSRGAPGTRDSYFGFSVALHRTAQESWLVVGAPRANSSYYLRDQITEPGAIFKCDLRSRECEELFIDQEGNELNPVQHVEFQYMDLKNRGWLGAALDTQPPGTGRQATAVCAPRWKNQLYEQTRLMNGACYWLNASLPNAPAHKRLPLIQFSKQTFSLRDRVLFYYSHGEAGLSVHFPDDATEMLVGAPGVFNWQGTVIRFKDASNIPGGSIARRRRQTVRQANSENQMFTQQTVPNPYRVAAVKDFDLMGYSVSSGRFRSQDELLYVGGAPRGADSFGKVIVFEFMGFEEDGVSVVQEWSGSQLGENFGASLASLDLNGDGLSDLVVGAPMYSLPDAIDAGRIQVFLSGQSSSQESSTALQPLDTRYMGRSLPRARFGTTLAACGDLNRDGYQDVAVGAPWEEDDGAVYIYLGSPTGLRQKYSQHLQPRHFSRNFKGFGMSLSRGIDMTNNGYPDLAIGSYNSGDAVVVPSRPVGSVRGSVSATPSTISLNATALELNTCFDYTGYNVPQNARIIGNLTLDHKFPVPRAFFTDTNTFVREFTHTASKEAVTCTTYQVKLRADKIDARQPVLLRMDFELEPNTGATLLREPVLDPSSSSVVSERVGIITGCELDGDDTCRIDLNVITSLSNQGKPILIGEEERPELSIAVYNTGEPVFLPNVTVSVEAPYALLLPTTHNCDFPSSTNRTSLTCRLRNPIMPGENDEVKVEVDVSGLDDRAMGAAVQVVVAGEGVEARPADNTVALPLEMGAAATLKLHGYSREEQILYQRLEEDKINTTSMPSFFHSFSLAKNGPTPLSEVELVLDIPINFTSGGTFLDIYHPKTNFLGQVFTCSLKGAQYAVDEEDNGDGGFVEVPFLTPKEHHQQTDVKSAGASSPISSSADPVYLNCTNPDISCAQLRCVIQAWPTSTNFADLSLKLALNLTFLAGHISAKGGAVLRSTGYARILSLNPLLAFTGERSSEVTVTTLIQPDSLPGEGVPWWVILLAVLGGLLLLALLALAMHKAGFFKRKEQEEMKAQRAQVSTQEYGAINPAMVDD